MKTLPGWPSRWRVGRIGRISFSNYLLVLTAVACIAGLELRHSYLDAQRDAQMQTRALALVIASSFNHTLEGVEHALRLIQHESGRADPSADPTGTPDSGAAQQFEQLLGHLHGSLALSTGIRIFDAQGQLLHTSVRNEPAFTIADRRYFERMRTDPGRDTFYSEVLMGRAAQRPVMVATRALRSPTGVFQGVAQVAIDLALLQAELRRLEANPDDAISIRRLDSGAKIVRLPGSLSLDNLPRLDLPGRQALNTGPHDEVSAETPSVIDGVVRMYTHRRVGTFPFYVSVGQVQERYLGAWRSKLRVYLVMLGLLAGVLLMTHHLQRRHLASLAASEARFQAIFDVSPMPMIVMRPDDRTQHLNPAFVRTLGYTLDDIPTQEAWLRRAYPDPSYRDWVEQAWASRMIDVQASAAEFRPLEVRVRTATDTTLDMVATSTQLPGEPHAAQLITLFDITERKQAEQALAALTHRYQLLFESSPDAYLLMDANQGVVVDCNHAVETMMRGPRERIIGCTPAQLSPPLQPDGRRSDEASRALVERMAREGDCHFEWMHRRCDGTDFWVEVGVSRVLIDRQPLLMGSWRDITERKRLEQELAGYRDHLEQLVERRTLELAIARDAAEAANKAKSAFLSTVSHELRTPLTGIMGTLALARRRVADPKLQEYLDIADRSSHHLLALIKDLLEMSRIEADRMALEDTDFQLADLLREVADAVAGPARDKGLALAFEVPAALGRLHFRGDVRRLAQVLINLTGNAVKFTAQGSVRVSVTGDGDAPQAPARLRFAVTDTGIGIRPDDLRRIFEPFEQADNSATRRFDGTGLGLFISQKLVRAMGGEIQVESQAGQGSTFHFEVPAHPGWVAPAPAPQSPPGEDAGAALQREFPGTRLLLVEDEPVNQAVTRELLQGQGLVVAVADDGETALAMCEATTAADGFALILMDLNMRRMGGVEATRRIRALPAYARTPIIALTANAFDEDREACLQAGLDDHLGKPVLPGALYARVLAWLRQLPMLSRPT